MTPILSVHCNDLEKNDMGEFRCFNSVPLILSFWFLVTVTTHAQTYTDLYDFTTSSANLEYPDILAQGLDGNFYGTLPYGGISQFGEIFKLTPSGQFSVLFAFNGSNGSYPDSGLVLGTDGNFYGTTFDGGTFGAGTIFRVTSDGVLTTLYNFTGDPAQDGANPYCFPAEGPDGNFYGTTDSGTAYVISEDGKFRLLTSSLPGHAIGPLILAQDGNFYGVTLNGGTNDQGAFYRMTPLGSVTTLYSFVESFTGGNPYGPLVEGFDGSFYGTASIGGSYGEGTIFRLSARGAATPLYSFQLATGDFPLAGLVLGNDGNLYGATISGGTDFVGVLFQLSTSKDYTILYSMDGTHGADPAATLIQSTNGKFYGLTNPGGLLDGGVFYSLDEGLPAFASLVNTIGRSGAKVIILGQGLTGTTSVSFDGTSASFKVLSDTALVAKVPSGATSGLVVITTPTGPLTSNRPFRVLP